MRASFLVMAVPFTCFAIACGDDEGSGGGGAAPTTSTTTTGATAPTTTGMPTTSSSTTTGGGNNPFSECVACAADACGKILQECGADPECTAWRTCAAACEAGDGLAACLDACDGAAIGFAPSHLVYACGCNACPTECGGVSACERKCNDGGPPATPGGTSTPNLAGTGLYLPNSTEIASWARSFQPQYPLWSDGATKNRYAYIPTCSPIDTSDPDHWDFPVGTRLWKEFTRDGIRIETRLIHKWGGDSGNWEFATYQWSTDAGSAPEDAPLVTGGVIDANGTGHDIPDLAQCNNCHGKLPEKVLGFSAIQMSHQLGGLDIFDLDAYSLTTEGPPNGGYVVPGDDITRQALGHLHSNCGNCHNPSFPVPDMVLRVHTTDMTPEDTGTYTTALDVPTTIYQAGTIMRIDGGDPSNSCVHERMAQSTMPPVGSEIADPEAGMNGIITQWIQSLP